MSGQTLDELDLQVGDEYLSRIGWFRVVKRDYSLRYPWVVVAVDRPSDVRRLRGGLRPVEVRRRSGWEKLSTPLPAGELGLKPGDVFKGGISGHTYTVVDYFRCTRDDGADTTLLWTSMVVSAVLRVDRPSTTPAVPVRPKITEVVCSSCGRTLGDFSDGTTPRSIVGPCCNNMLEPWTVGRLEQEADGVPYEDDESS